MTSPSALSAPLRESLSTEALRLLSHLKTAQLDSPARAATDDALAAAIHLPHRAIIDAAGELLEAGYLVLAGPSGRWLLPPESSDLRSAYDYERSLRGRAVAVLARRKAVRRAIALYESGRIVDQFGQLNLFQETCMPR